MEPRKAPTSPPNLELYALAEARFDDLEKLPACGRCKDCPGPEAKGSRCFEWPDGAPALKRRDWPMCPVGMTKVVTWRRIVERFIAAKVSPVDGWTDDYLASAYEGGVRLHVALRREEDRRIDERRSAPRSGSGAPFKTRLTGGKR